MSLRSKQWILKNMLYLLILWVATPVSAGIFGGPSQCGIVLKGLESLEDSEIKNQEIIDSSKGAADKVLALFQRLPKKLRKEVAFNLGVYLTKYSPRPDALDLATHIYYGERMGPKSFNLAKDQLRKGEYLTATNKDYLEFSLRMHPRLNDLMRFFKIPGVEIGFASSQIQQGSIEAQLGNLEPLQAQMVVRAAIDELIKTEDKTVNPYAFIILMKVATNLVGDKGSRALAKGLPDAYGSASLFPKVALADQQIRRAVRKLLSVGITGEALARVKSAINKSLGTVIFTDDESMLFSVSKGVAIGGALIYNIVDIIGREDFEKARRDLYFDKYRWGNGDHHDYYESLSDFTGYTYLDHWKVQAATLGLILSAYTLKGLYHFMYDLREPNPGGFLRAETDFEIQQFKDDLQQQTNSVLKIMGTHIQNVAPVIVAPVIVAPVIVAPVIVAPVAPVAPAAPLSATAPAAIPAVVPGKNAGINDPAEPAHSSADAHLNKGTSVEDLPEGQIWPMNATTTTAMNSQNHWATQNENGLAFKNRSLKAKDVRREFSEKRSSRWNSLTPEQEKANHDFFKFFNEVKLHLLERDTLIEHLQVGYLLKEPVNIQMLGEAGVAKTHVASQIMGRITDASGQPSFFRTQMGVNTTIGELIGTVKQSGLKEDRIIRAAERGLPGYENNFLDEYFNAPTDTRQDLLTLQSEGVLTMGGETYKSKSRMNLYASNKYPDQVFFEAGNDAPRAEMDRMLFTHIVSPTFEYDDNMLDLEELRETPLKAHLTFSEIDELRGLADHIEVPRYYLAKTKLIINRLRQIEIKREHESKVAWIQRERNGEVNLTPPTYMARVLSPRSEKRAYQLLKAFALADWLAGKANSKESSSIETSSQDSNSQDSNSQDSNSQDSNSQDSNSQELSVEPEITEIHFAKLVEFFVFNGPSDDHIDRILREYVKGSVPHQQFSTLKKRRQEFFDLLSVTDREVSLEQPMKELAQFLEALHIGVGGLEIEGLKLNSQHRLNDTNASIVSALIEWHKGLSEQIAAKGKIKEMSTSEVALLKAENLGGKLIQKLLEP